MKQQVLKHILHVFINDKMVENTLIKNVDFNPHELMKKTMDTNIQKYPGKKVKVKLDTEMIITQEREMYHKTTKQ